MEMFKEEKAGKTEKAVKKQLVSDEQAVKEIDSWLDYKKIDENQREEHETFIKALVSYIKSGHLILNEDDMSLTHKLKFPMDKADISELVYKARITEREITQKLHGVKADDSDGRLCAHIAALTGQVRGIITNMDKEDYKIARSIAIFFL
jgi:hypothetical protein